MNRCEEVWPRRYQAPTLVRTKRYYLKAWKRTRDVNPRPPHARPMNPDANMLKTGKLDFITQNQNEHNV